ncbi:MAG: HNH endonuclease signature motif containing protein [Acidimicrobiales bacterium]
MSTDIDVTITSVAAIPPTDPASSQAVSQPECPLVQLEAAIDLVLESGLVPVSSETSTLSVAYVQKLANKMHAVQLGLMDQIESNNMYRGDGHANVKVLVRHGAQLSNGEALDRNKTMRMLRELSQVRDALWAGAIGVEQVQLLGRVHSNPRVSGAMTLRQERFVADAKKLTYKMFELRVREWERLIDEDGSEPENERTHRRRNARLVQDPIDLSWELVAKFAAMMGMAMRDVLDHYIEAEWQADWEKARAEHGDDACNMHLARTDPQRRADALWQIFQDAAGADGSAVPPGFVHNIVWDSDTYEQMVRRIDGEEAQPLDPDTYRCESVDGTPLEPNEAVINSLVASFRRVLVDARGVVLDMGERRFFTGPLRDAINLHSKTCVWPGCQVPSSKCEADHLVEHSRKGRTCPGNGAPLCGMHNRWKQKGFIVTRDPSGQWRTVRPDGTEVT